MAKNSGTGMPKKEGFTGKKVKTSDLYMKNGVPCGDIEAIGPRGKGPSGAGAGPSVGGYNMGVHNSFDNGIPNAGKESILSQTMTPAHKENKSKGVLDTKEDPTWGGIIRPTDMSANNKIGV